MTNVERRAITTELDVIRIATNVLLEKLTKERMAEEPFRRGGVNWSDLKCCNVEWCMDLDGNTLFRVTIDEVSPDEYELQKYVYEGLQHFGIVEVITEW